MTKHLLCILTLTGCLSAQTSQDSEIGSLKFRLQEEQVRVAPTDATAPNLSWYGGTPGKAESTGRISLEIEHLEGELEVLEADEPSRQIVFSWSALASQEGMELHLYNPEQPSNQVYLLFGGPGGDFYWQQERLGDQETVTSILPPMSWLTLWGSEPLVGYVVWKRNRQVDWIDQGERVSGFENQGVADYQVVVEGAPVALQVEITSEATATLHRSPLLRPGVSLIANTEEGITRAVWVATDLRSIGSQVLGTIRVDEPGAQPEMGDWTASDFEGNVIPVTVRIVRQP